jgi:hypothetical protein
VVLRDFHQTERRILIFVTGLDQQDVFVCHISSLTRVGEEMAD